MPPIKPGLWSVNPADVDPGWLWFWQYAGHAAVYNEGAGAPFDYATRQPASTVTSIDWVNTAYGVGPKRDASTDRLIWTARDDFSLLADIDFSVGIVFDANSYDTNGGLIVARDDTADGFWEFIVTNAPAISFSWRVSGGSQSVSWTLAAAPSAGIRSFVVARRVGGVYELWIDGVSQGTQTNTTAPDTSRAHDLEIGRRGNNTSDVRGTCLMSFVLKGLALNDVMARRLAADPFGPFRPAPIAGGLTVTLYATGDGTISTLEDEGGATTDLWQSIDDDPATPTDADWINNINELSGGDASGFFDITNMPGDFGNADGASIVVRVAANDVAATHKLYVRLFKSDETATISDEVELLDVSTSSGQTNYAGTITGVDGAATKAEWDAARIRLRWSVT